MSDINKVFNRIDHFERKKENGLNKPNKVSDKIINKNKDKIEDIDMRINRQKESIKYKLTQKGGENIFSIKKNSKAGSRKMSSKHKISKHEHNKHKLSKHDIIKQTSREIGQEVGREIVNEIRKMNKSNNEKNITKVPEKSVFKPIDNIVHHDQQGGKHRTERPSDKHVNIVKKNKTEEIPPPQIIGGLKQYGYKGVEYLTKEQRKVALKKAMKDMHPLTLVQKIEGVATLTKNRNPNRSNIFFEDANWIKERWNAYKETH